MKGSQEDQGRCPTLWDLTVKFSIPLLHSLAPIHGQVFKVMISRWPSRVLSHPMLRPEVKFEHYARISYSLLIAHKLQALSSWGVLPGLPIYHYHIREQGGTNNFWAVPLCQAPSQMCYVGWFTESLQKYWEDWSVFLCVNEGTGAQRASATQSHC